MQELSLNILDIAQNSIKANANIIEIKIEKCTQTKSLIISIKDNGDGMSDEMLKKVVDPFFTTRTTRKVGLGIPFFKMSAELTGGYFKIESDLNKGTHIKANYFFEHIDMLPIGSIEETMVSLISVNPNIDFIYSYTIDKKEFLFETTQIKEILKGVPINSPDVLAFIKTYIKENQQSIN